MLKKVIKNLISKIHVTVHGAGTKLAGILSINTPNYCNKQCMKNAQVEGSICQKCYATRYLKMRKRLRDALERNYKLLTSSILPLNELPRFNTLYGRFESFGDLSNEIQFINYLNVCNVNPQTTFAIWTKNPHIISAVLNDMGYKKPDNLIIIVSSLFINIPWKYKILPYADRYWFIDKIFTVYDKKTIKEKNININCGARDCMSCGLCYTKNNVKEINEELK